jgi:E3 ubiquitin-protein ligase HUWE1
VAGPSGAAAPATVAEDYSAILGIDISELPEGVDPSFLAALPEDMRQEVIDEQRRLQAIRQRAAQNTEAGITEVNAEFLAALPPNIQVRPPFQRPLLNKTPSGRKISQMAVKVSE